MTTSTIPANGVKLLILLRDYIVNGAAVPGEIARAFARYAGIDKNMPKITFVASGRETATAKTWLRIAAATPGRDQISALTAAAVCAHAGGDYKLAGQAIAWQHYTTATHDIEQPILTRMLELDCRIAAHLHTTR